jgi:hypothetical protein
MTTIKRSDVVIKDKSINYIRSEDEIGSAEVEVFEIDNYVFIGDMNISFNVEDTEEQHNKMCRKLLETISDKYKNKGYIETFFKNPCGSSMRCYFKSLSTYFPVVEINGKCLEIKKLKLDDYDNIADGCGSEVRVSFLRNCSAKKNNGRTLHSDDYKLDEGVFEYTKTDLTLIDVPSSEEIGSVSIEVYDDYVYIDYIEVDEQLQGMGFCGLLIERVSDIAKSRGCKYVYLHNISPAIGEFKGASGVKCYFKALKDNFPYVKILKKGIDDGDEAGETFEIKTELIDHLNKKEYQKLAELFRNGNDIGGYQIFCMDKKFCEKVKKVER